MVFHFPHSFGQTHTLIMLLDVECFVIKSIAIKNNHMISVRELNQFYLEDKLARFNAWLERILHPSMTSNLRLHQWPSSKGASTTFWSSFLSDENINEQQKSDWVYTSHQSSRPTIHTNLHASATLNSLLSNIQTRWELWGHSWHYKLGMNNLCSVWILSKKIIKPNFFLKKIKTEIGSNRPVLDWFDLI